MNRVKFNIIEMRDRHARIQNWELNDKPSDYSGGDGRWRISVITGIGGCQ